MKNISINKNLFYVLCGCLFFVVILFVYAEWNLKEVKTQTRHNILKQQGVFNEIKLKSINGKPSHQFELAKHYLSGIGTKKNIDEALYWFTKAAEQDYADAQFFLGKLYNDSNFIAPDKQKSVYWYEKASHLGHLNAQVFLGLAFLSGDGVELNEEKGLDWLQKAAEKGNKYAQFNLGGYYRENDNLDEAKKWFFKAANQGLSAAQFNIAKIIIDTNKGNPAKLMKAGVFLKSSADNGEVSALEYTEDLTSNCLLSEKITKDNSISCIILAGAGNLEAMFIVASFFDSGNFVNQNLNLAFDLYKRASEQGHIKSIAMLSSAYGKGRGVEKNTLLSFVWLSILSDFSSEIKSESHMIQGAQKTLASIEKSISKEQMIKIHQLKREIVKNKGILYE